MGSQTFLGLLIVWSLTILACSLISADPTPHLRIGETYLLPETTLMVSPVNRSHILFCDAFQSVLPPLPGSQPEFDGMIWRFANNNSVIYSTPYTLTNATTRLYSIIFLPWEELGSCPNILLQCCTTLSSQIVMCQSTYIMIDPTYFNHTPELHQIASKLLVFMASLVLWINLWTA